VEGAARTRRPRRIGESDRRAAAVGVRPYGLVHVLGFLAVALVVVVTPGVDMALVTKNALVHGRRQALATAFGVNVGIAAWTLAAALGVAAVVQASAAAFTVIKLAGALYLIYLGVQALRHARRRNRSRVLTRPSLGAAGAFRQGLVSNLLNPKIAVFFTSLLPQFVDHATLPELLFLGALFNAMGIVWLTAYALAAARGRVFLQRPRVAAALDYLSGFVLVGLGMRLALERRD
jgi:threonine/homoserine/homoserine lactone efflux protein